MTDEELICEWMEPRPTKSIYEIVRANEPYPGKWWIDRHPSSSEWRPCNLTLDYLHEVEARLIREGHGKALSRAYAVRSDCQYDWFLDATQKINTLAAFIREEIPRA